MIWQIVRIGVCLGAMFIMPSVSEAFDLNARKCFGHMHDPARVWNDYMPRCFNEKNATSCGQATSNSRDAECLHDLNLQIARISINSGRYSDAAQSVRYAVRNVDTAEAWITLGIASNGMQLRADERVARFDEVIGKLGNRALDPQQARAFEALKEQRAKAVAVIGAARAQSEEVNRQAAADFDALKARCGSGPELDGKPTFMFGNGATNYLRDAAAWARNNSTGVVAELYDRRRSQNVYGKLIAQSGAMLQQFVCVRSMKYVRHVTTRNEPLVGKVHVAEVRVIGIGRDLNDIEKSVELVYSD